jgi:xanthosine utilization system XapX-like protein
MKHYLLALIVTLLVGEAFAQVDTSLFQGLSLEDCKWFR